MATEVTIKTSTLHKYAALERALISAVVAARRLQNDELVNTLLKIKALSSVSFDATAKKTIK